MSPYGRKDELGLKRRRLFPDPRLRFAPPVAEKDESEVRWLISYSDFMMQLVCLFILLYSVSSIDTTKAVPLAQAWREEMGIGEVRVPMPPKIGPLPLTMLDLPRIQRETVLVAGRFPEGRTIRILPRSDGFRIRFREEMFEAGSSRLTPAGERIADLAASLLKPYQDQVGLIEISGHASSEEPGSLLHLSAARAEETIRWVTRVEAPARLDPLHLSAAAYAANEPAQDGVSPISRRQNRRVEFGVRVTK